MRGYGLMKMLEHFSDQDGCRFDLKKCDETGIETRLTAPSKVKTALSVVLAGSLSAALMTSTALAAGQLNMSCSFAQPICDKVKNSFEADTGIVVNMVRLSAGETYARIRAEARNPKTDVWIGSTVGPQIQAADEDLTHSYQSPSFAGLHEWAYKLGEETDFKVYVLGSTILGFTWNRDMLAQKNLPAPQCWADLLKDEYRQEISISNPNTAGTGYSAMINMVNLMGDDAGFDYMKKLNANITNYTKSGSAPGAAAARGEVTIGVIYLHDVQSLIQQGFPLDYTVPCEGVGLNLDGMAIVKGAKNLSEAEQFVDWALTAKGQQVINESGYFGYPSARGTQISEYTVDISPHKIIDLDLKYYGLPERRKTLLERWGREIGAIAGQ